jgi:WD40 repeat protein
MISVSWSGDGKHIALGSTTVLAWDALTGKHIVQVTDQMASVWVRWSPDGKRLATSSEQVKVWDGQTHRLLATFTPAMNAASSSGAGRVPAANAAQQLSGGNMVLDSSWSPDGKYIASAVDGNAVGFNVQIWNSRTGALMHKLEFKQHPDAGDYVNSVAWSPDGKYIAAGGMTKQVWIWEAATGKMIRTYQNGDTINGVSWSPDSKLLAFDNGNNVQIWDPFKQRIVASFESQQGQNGVSSVAWSPNGKYIASAGHDVRIWDVTAGKTAYIYKGHGSDAALYIRSLSWSPDSTMIVSVGGGMHVTAPHTGKAFGSVNVWIAAS